MTIRDPNVLLGPEPVTQPPPVGFVLPARGRRHVAAPQMPRGFYGVVEFEFVDGRCVMGVVTEKVKP